MMINRRLSILQVITQRRFSGAERICLSLCEALQQRGHRIRLMCKETGQMADEARALAIEVITPGISGKLNLLAPGRIIHSAREIKADIIHTHLSTASLMGGIAGKISGIPVLGHVHALNTWQYYRFSTLIATCSAGVARHIIAKGAPAEKIRVILNGIDLHRFDNIPSKAESRQRLQLPAGVPIIGCVAHLSAKKGQEYLLKAVALLRDKSPNIQCLLVGEGPMREDLLLMANQLGIGDRVHLLGYRSDVVSVMNAMDIVVLPSIAKEGLGLVLVEAALLKIPTIGSDAPGIDEAVLNEVSGFLVPPGNADMLAEKIIELLENPLLREQMGEAGFTRAHNQFSLDAMIDSTEAVYREMITHGQ